MQTVHAYKLKVGHGPLEFESSLHSIRDTAARANTSLPTSFTKVTKGVYTFRTSCPSSTMQTASRWPSMMQNWTSFCCKEKCPNSKEKTMWSRTWKMHRALSDPAPVSWFLWFFRVAILAWLSRNRWGRAVFCLWHCLTTTKGFG